MEISHHKYTIQKQRLKDIDTDLSFFDSFKSTYSPYYVLWLQKKMQDSVYVSYNDDNIIGFMKLKIENEEEDYSDITPIFLPCKRLKICSLKIESSIYGLSRQFMEIVLDNAIQKAVSEIYATIAENCIGKEKLIHFLQKYGFKKHGTKFSHGIQEDVFSMSINQFNSHIDNEFNANYLASDSEKVL